MEVVRYKLWSGCCLVAKCNGVASFTGLVAGKQPPTMREQVDQILARYTDLIQEYGLKMENLIEARAYSKDITRSQDFHDAMKAWCADYPMPNCTLIGAAPSSTYI